MANHWKQAEPRLLDYIAYGVPRSGTTALGLVLNRHPQVTCGIEFFMPRADHAKIFFPESFFIAAPHIGRGPDVIDVLNTRQTIRAAGNKSPQYYLMLHKVIAELQRPKCVITMREPLALAKSWSTRAMLYEKMALQVGVFGALSLPICMGASMIEDGVDMLVVPFAAFSSDNLRLAHQVVEFLAPGSEGTFDADDTPEQHRQMSRRRPKAEIQPQEEEAAALVTSPELTELLARPDCFTIAETREALVAWLRQVPEDMLDRLPALVEGYGLDGMDGEIKRFMNRNERIWTRVTETLKDGRSRPVS